MLCRLRSEVRKRNGSGREQRNHSVLCCCRDSAGALHQGARFPSFLVTVPVNGERGVAAKKNTSMVTKWTKWWKKTQFDGNFSVISSNPRPLFLRCSCTVQHSQLTLLRCVRRFYANLLTPVTRQWHLRSKTEALEGLQQFVAFTVNFCQIKRKSMLRV